MKKTKLLYLGLFLVAFFAVVVVLGSINSPQSTKTAEETQCVASSLAGVSLVNGLGNDIKIPLFPDAKRLSFADTGATQYTAKAQDVEILSFYSDRMRSLCWQVKEQKQNEIVYTNNEKTVRISLLTNPIGKTIIDYVVLSPEGVLGTVKIAQQTCSEGQYYCNGGCIPSGTSCQPPTDSSSCTGGTIWCTSSSGTGGWCQMSPCPSSSGTYTPPSNTGSTCSGTYQQSGTTTPNCNYSTCPNGCTWDSSGCPNGCYTSSSTTNTGSWPTDQATCSSRGYFWCTPSGSTSGGWCQSTACSTTAGNYEDTQIKCSDNIDNDGDSLIDRADPGCSAFSTSTGPAQCSDGVDNDSDGKTDYPADVSCYGPDDQDEYYPSSTPTSSGSCPSGQFWCNNACISSSSYCPPSTSGSSYAGDANSCPGFAYSRWDSTSRRYCQLNNEARCDYNYPSYLTNGSNYTAANCPTTGGTGCAAGQYLCSGTCTSNNTACSPSSWPTDSASCASQGKYWCTPSGGGSGWCQTSVCPASSQTTTQQQTTQQQQASFCSPGLTWCVYENGCITSGRPCYPTGSQQTTQQQTTQTQQQTNTQQQQANTQQPTNCPADQRYCPSSNTCIPMNGQCGSGTTQGYGQGTYGDNKGQGMGPSEENEKRMQEQRFRDMKRGMDQFAKGVTQMQKYVAKMKTTLSRAGVGIPAELTNALAKAPELLAKLKAAKTADELDELMGDLQDIGMTMQEWGPRLGDLQRLVSMMKNVDKDLKSMRANFTRVQKAAKKRPELAEPLKEAEALFADMAKRVAEIKVLAKTDPEGALDLVEEFYGNTEEFWNQVSFLDMVSNITRGLAQANTQIRQIETKIRSMARIKGADKEYIAMLQEQLAEMKAALPELRKAMAERPVDYEEVKILAEDFWMQLQELQNTMADQGQSFYMPTVKSGQGLNVVIPEGFLGSSGGGGQGPQTGPAF